MTVLARLPLTMPGMASRSCLERSTIGAETESLLADMKYPPVCGNRRLNKLTPPRARSLPCGRRIRDKPSWEAHLPSECRGRCLLRVHQPLHRKSNHISSTSTYAYPLLSKNGKAQERRISGPDSRRFY